MSVFIMGDVHGNFSAIERWISTFARFDDTLIQVGDFGAGMVYSERIKSLSWKLEDKGVKLLAIRGNHDNPHLFNENTKYGRSIELLPDNTVRTIEGNTFLFLGGAVSVDRYFRTMNKDWWVGEEYNIDTAFIQDQRNIDIVISHTCPNSATPFSTMKNDVFLAEFYEVDKSLHADLLKEKSDMELTYNLLKVNNNIKEWYYGHFHVSENTINDQTKFRCLDINEIVLLR